MDGPWMALLLLCFRQIKMSSPNMNNLIIVGCILTYSSVILLGLVNYSFHNQLNTMMFNLILPKKCKRKKNNICVLLFVYFRILIWQALKLFRTSVLHELGFLCQVSSMQWINNSIFYDYSNIKYQQYKIYTRYIFGHLIIS